MRKNGLLFSHMGRFMEVFSLFVYPIAVLPAKGHTTPLEGKRHFEFLPFVPSQLRQIDSVA